VDRRTNSVHLFYGWMMRRQLTMRKGEGRAAMGSLTGSTPEGLVSRSKQEHLSL